VLKGAKNPPFFVGLDLSNPNLKEGVAGVVLRSEVDGKS